VAPALNKRRVRLHNEALEFLGDAVWGWSSPIISVKSNAAATEGEVVAA